MAQSTPLPAAANNHFGDMDGDGKMDVVVHGPTIGLQLWLGNGSGSGFTKADAGLPGPEGRTYGIDVGDLDGNGHLDIVRAYEIKSGYGTLEAWVR